MSSVRIIINATPMPPAETLRKTCAQYGIIYAENYTGKYYSVTYNTTKETVFAYNSLRSTFQVISGIIPIIDCMVRDGSGKRIELQLELEYAKVERSCAKKALSKENAGKKRESPRRSFSRSRSRSHSASRFNSLSPESPIGSK